MSGGRTWDKRYGVTTTTSATTAATSATTTALWHDGYSQKNVISVDSIGKKGV